MKYFKKLEGEKVYLSPINPEDYELYTKWLNDDKGVSKYIDQDKKVIGITKEKEILESQAKSGYNFAIVLKESDQLIGNISLMKISFIDKIGEIGLFIGPKEEKGKGYGPEAIKLLLDYGFNALNLQNIELGVYSFNERAIKAYKKLGFKEYGRRTKSKYLNGEYYDLVLMEYLKK